VATNQGGMLIENGNLAVISEIGRTSGCGGQNGHEPLHFAAGLSDRIEEGIEDEHTAHCIDQQAHLNTLFRTLGKELDDAATYLITTNNKGGDVDAVLGF
jgi:hypothetical protein